MFMEKTKLSDWLRPDLDVLEDDGDTGLQRNTIAKYSKGSKREPGIGLLRAWR